MNKEPVTPCDFAKFYYFHALRWLNLWNLLVFVFGVTIVLFLVAAVLLFIRATWLPGVLTTFGAIVNSVGVTWVVNQKAAAAKEERDAFRQIKKVCQSPGMGFVGVEQQPWFNELRLLAKKSLGLGSVGMDNEIKL